MRYAWFAIISLIFVQRGIAMDMDDDFTQLKMFNVSADNDAVELFAPDENLSSPIFGSNPEILNYVNILNLPFLPSASGTQDAKRIRLISPDTTVHNNNNDDDDDDDDAMQQNNNIVIAHPQTFPQAAALAVVQEHRCNVCAKLCNSLRSFTNHQRTHPRDGTNPQPYVCDQPRCAYDYKYQRGLDEHLLKHHRIIVPGNQKWLNYAHNYLSEPHRIVKRKQRTQQTPSNQKNTTNNNNNSNDK